MRIPNSVIVLAASAILVVGCSPSRASETYDANGFYLPNKTIDGVRLAGWGINCNGRGNDHFGWLTAPADGRFIDTVTENDSHVFDERFVQALLANVIHEGRIYCAQQQKWGNISAIPENYRIYTGDQNGGPLGMYLTAIYLASLGRWEIHNNYRDAMARNLAMQRATADHRQREAALRASNVSTFVARFGVKSFQTSSDIVANPFLFKGRVVGIHTEFVRMLSENEALFSDNVIVSGVPSARFRGKEEVVLAVRVRGTMMYEQTSTPDLQYVGDHACAQLGCFDFYRPN